MLGVVDVGSLDIGGLNVGVFGHRGFGTYFFLDVGFFACLRLTPNV